MDTIAHTYLLLLIRNRDLFQRQAFLLALETQCPTASKSLVQTEHLEALLIHSQHRASALRRHIDTCPRSGLAEAIILELGPGRYLPPNHPAAGWLTRHMGDAPD